MFHHEATPSVRRALCSCLTSDHIPTSQLAATSCQRIHCRRVALSPCDASSSSLQRLCIISADDMQRRSFMLSQWVCRPSRPAHPIVQLSLPWRCRCFHQHRQCLLSRHLSLIPHGVANHNGTSPAGKIKKDIMVLTALTFHSVFL